jgi:hypothetical protein
MQNDICYVSQHNGLTSLHSPFPGLGIKTLNTALLTPTRIWIAEERIYRFPINLKSLNSFPTKESVPILSIKLGSNNYLPNILGTSPINMHKEKASEMKGKKKKRRNLTGPASELPP